MPDPLPDGELELEELRLLEPEEEATGWKAESLPEPIRLGRGGAGEDPESIKFKFTIT